MSKSASSHSWVKWLIVVGIILVAVITKPDKAKHSEKLQGYFMEQASDSDNVLGSALTALLGPYVIDNILIVDDYFVFNVGRIKYKDTDKAVTIGLFNTVMPLP